MRTILLRDP